MDAGVTGILLVLATNIAIIEERRRIKIFLIQNEIIIN